MCGICSEVITIHQPVPNHVESKNAAGLSVCTIPRSRVNYSGTVRTMYQPGPNHGESKNAE